MFCAKRFNENALTTNLSFSLSFPFLTLEFCFSGIPHQAEVTRTSVSLLNVKCVLSTVTVITPNQYSADGCQRGTSHLISPRLTSPSSDDTGNYPTIRRSEKTRSVAGSSTEFSKEREGGGPSWWATGSDWKTANNCGLTRWTGEGTGGRNALNKSRR